MKVVVRRKPRIPRTTTSKLVPKDILTNEKVGKIRRTCRRSLSNWAALAESERTGVVAIAKAAKDTAYARTRQIKVANPIDREEANKYSTKTLANFLYPCQTLATVFDKTSIARLDLAVFSERGVPWPQKA